MNQLTKNNMWKKFIALMAIVVSVATLTTFSVPASAAGVVISNLTANPSSFNPAEGDTSVLRFNILKVADLDVYLYDSDDQLVEQLVSGLRVGVGQKTITFYGTSGNSPSGAILPDDTYTIVVLADALIGPADSDEVEVTIDAEGPSITNLEADPAEFDATAYGANTTISFTTDEDAYITALILDADGNDVRSFSAFDGSDLIEAGDQSFDWNGKDDDGDVVEDGDYTIEVTAEDENGNEATETATVTVDEDAGHPGNGVLSGLVLKPSSDWDPSDEILEIEVDVLQDVDELYFEAKNPSTGETVEINDLGSTDKENNLEEEWNGEDEDGDYVEAGTWEIRVIAEIDSEKYVVKDSIDIEYETPELDDYYVTKNPFDPSEDEYTYFVFNTDGDALVTIEVQETDGSTVIELWDEEEVEDGDWYAVKWDGEDEDGDIVDEDDYEFYIEVANINDEDTYTTETVPVEVEDDEESSSKKVNIYGDYVEPVIIDKGDELTIGYCIEDDAEVTVQIFEGKSTTGNGDIVVVDGEDQDEDCYTVSFEWTGRDDDNKSMDKGVFTYEIETKNGSNKAYEKGLFIYGAQGDDGDDDDDDDDYYGDCTKYYRDLGSLRDGELCTAIAWATEQGIFSGYPDGSFKPYTNINRAETLKVLLEAYEAPLLPPNGSNLGFWDLDPYAWYMTYARTGQFYDMLDGYPDGAARLGNYINRVEMLKFALEAAHSFTGASVYDLSYNYNDVERNSWYAKYLGASYTYGLYDSQYYGNSNYLMPGQNVQRGEMALMLYRMDREGLLD